MKNRHFLLLAFNLALIFPVFAQTYLIQGEVLDFNSGKGLAGANILESESQERGTVTDERGFFAIAVKDFPVELQISHVGYETKQLTLDGLVDTLMVINLEPKIHEIPDINIIAEKKIKSFSEVERYSVVDYEILDQKIVILEYHGSFKTKLLTLFDFDQNQIQQLELKDIRNVQELYKGCNGILYLLTPRHAYPFEIKNNQLSSLRKLRLNTFYEYIKPCKIRNKNDFYYLVEDLNGLKNTISRYGIQTEQSKTIRTILDEDLAVNYLREVGFQIPNSDLKAMLTNDYSVNNRLRLSQFELDFITRVFYKLEHPIHIFFQEEELVLLNHPGQKIERYQLDTLKAEVEIAYPDDKNWLKEVIQDEKDQKLYTVFKYQDRIKIKEIDLETGDLKDIDTIDAYTYRVNEIKIVGGYLFYLKENAQEMGRRELIRHKI